MTHEDRFKQFFGSLPGIEPIDTLFPAGSFPNKRRADYLLAQRRIVIELKTLKTDTSAKVEKELTRHRDRSDFPLIYGSVEVAKILRHLPDGEQINRKIYQDIARSVEDAVRSAETQITDTEEILSLTGNVGLLVLLNENIDVLSPHVVVRRTSELLCRRRTDNSVHTSIDFVWLLFESHVTQTSDNSTAHPSILLEGPTASTFEWFGAAFDELQTSWADVNNSPLIRSSVEKIVDMEFRSTSGEGAASTEKLKRHEQWERQYKAAPYLRNLSDDAVLDHGVQTFKVLRPYFLDGGPRLPMDQLELLFIKWSDFLQESRHRGLNLRDLQNRI